VLGEGRVHVVSYEQSVQRDGSVIPAILQALGLDPASLPSSEGIWDHRTHKRRAAAG
jgi:hypothetical protein